MQELLITIVKGLVENPDAVTVTVDEADEGVLLPSGIALKTVIGAVIGLILATAFFFVYDVIVNDTLNSDEWITDIYNEEIPLLAVIPDVNYSSSKRYGNNRYYKKTYESVTESSKVK